MHLHELLTDIAAYDSGSEAKDAHQFLDLRLRRNQAQAEHEKDLATGRSCGLGSGDVLAEAVVDSFRGTAVAVGAVSSTSTEGDYRRVYEQSARLALVLADQDGDGARVSSGRRCDYELTFHRRDAPTVLPGDVLSWQRVRCATVRNAAGKECSWTHSLSEGSAEDSLGLERKVEKVEFDMEEFVVALVAAKSIVGERYEVHAYYDLEDRKFWFRWCRRI